MGIIRHISFFMLLGLLGNLATLELKTIQSDTFCGIPKTDASKIVSNIVGNVKTYLKAKYDPLFIKHTGSVRNLKVDGLGTIERIGNSLMQIDKEVMKHEFNMSFKIINAEADVKRLIWKPLDLRITGTAHATIKGLKLYGVLRIDFKDCTSPKLERLLVKDWGVVFATIQNGNWLGKIASWFPDIITQLIKKDVPAIIETVFKKVLRELKM